MRLESKKLLASIFIVFSALYLSACTWSDPVKVEDDFGNSVRHMLEQQKQASKQMPIDNMPTGIDGNSAINSLEQYRAAQKRKVQKESLDSFELTD